VEVGVVLTVADPRMGFQDVVDKIETVEQEDGGIKFHINW
jgi:hypothetical protein